MRSLSLLAHILLLLPSAFANPKKKNSDHDNNAPLSPNLERDIKTLLKFKETVKTDPHKLLETWVEGSNPCKWKGILCSKLPGTNTDAIFSLQLNEAGLDGPDMSFDFIEELSDISIVHVNTNGFKIGPGGEFPNISAEKLPWLFEFDISNNHFSGDFPKSMVKAVNLTWLDIRYNKFEGQVPSEIFDVDTDVLFINNNNFNGKISDNIGKFHGLMMTIANNQLEGPIPSSIGDAKTMTEFVASGNQLSSKIPVEFSKLTNMTLLDVSINELTGEIPSELAALKNLEILDVSSNKLHGEIPDALCEIKSLSTFNVSHNPGINKMGPACLKLFKKGKDVLDINQTCIEEAGDLKAPEKICDTFKNSS